MIFDLTQRQIPPEHRYDTCILGAGAAGITLARKLAQTGRRVALCEGGELSFTGDSQDIYIGEVRGDPYFDLDACRLRFFGGSTNHWGGMCRTLDAVDFQRGYLGPEYEWPIQKADLDPYLAPACDIVEIDTQFDDARLAGDAGVERVDFKFSAPVNFAFKYEAEIAASDAIDLYLGANFLDFASDGDTSSRATSALVETYDGTQISVQAERFVLAMGGIENARSLLWLRERHGGRFFDATTPVGRYWMEHPHFALGEALVETEVEAGKYYAIAGEVQAEQGILNSMLELDRQGQGGTRRMVNELLCVAPRLGERMLALAERNLVCGVRFKSAWEQAPDVTNRVALSDTERDRFGVPRPELHWRKTDMDRRTVASTCAIFNTWLQDRDLGRLRLDDWFLDADAYPENAELAGNHHMGGTRMGTRRDLSVVDGNCRLHGADNIYVAGSSVFTTGGHANPTLSILQLTLRLADHLVG